MTDGAPESQRNGCGRVVLGETGETLSIPDPVRLESLRIRNFRVLRRVEFRKLTPLTVLVGPNGCGKSTVGDAVAFLGECFRTGLARAWAACGGAEGIRTRGSDGPIVFELAYRERKRAPAITYHLEIEEQGRGPIVAREWLRWKPRPREAPLRFLDCDRGRGRVIGGETPTADAEPRDFHLSSPDLLAAAAFGQFRDHPRAAALCEFLRGWRASRAATPGPSPPGPGESDADLAQVVQRLSARDPERYRRFMAPLRRWIPRFGRLAPETAATGRPCLRIEETSFPEPLPARLASGGTTRVLATLCRLHDAESARLLALDTPEASLHPRLLPELAEECRGAVGQIQLLAATHSPFFVGVLRPREVRVLWRNEAGTTETCRAAEVAGVVESVEAGGHLGLLWAEGHLDGPFDSTRSGARVSRLAGSRV